MRTIVGAALLGLVLTGCTGGAEGTDSSDKAPDSGQVSEGTSGDGPVPFGEEVETEDGVTVTVATPQPLVLSKAAVAGGEPDFIKFEVTLSNRTDARISPSEVSLTVASGDGQGGEVLDRRNGLDGPPTGKVPPGDSRSWEVGFGVMDAEDVRIQVQVGMDAAPVTFGAES